MPMKKLVMPVILAVLVTGCSDDRLTQLAREAADRQARQNEEMARVTRDSTEATKRLVEAESQARTELNAMQKNLIDGQGQLEDDRKDLANERYRESILAPIISTLGATLICVLPVAVCWYLLHGLREETSNPEVMEYLVQEITAEQPLLLPRCAMTGMIGHALQQPTPPNPTIPSA